MFWVKIKIDLEDIHQSYATWREECPIYNPKKSPLTCVSCQWFSEEHFIEVEFLNK